MKTRKTLRKAKANEIFGMIKAKVDVPKLMRKVDDELWAPGKTPARKKKTEKKRKKDILKLAGFLPKEPGGPKTYSAKEIDEVVYGKL
ncbi:MAG: hypothetical protein WCX64_04520 [Candidatus Micrarchaeia archaeon]|jgi:hypothetical protein